MAVRFWPLALLLLLLPAVPAAAFEVRLAGEFQQGGLVTGAAPEGAVVTLDGKSVPVTSGGSFLIAFGRDAPRRLMLAVRVKGKTIFRRGISIRKRVYQVQRIDGLPRRKVTPSPADLKRIGRESAAIAAARATISDDASFQTGFAWPARGRISGVYGSTRILNGKPRRPHLGLDVAAPEGTPVRAAAAGRIAFAHPGMFFNGKTVVIDHGLGLTSAYLHMSAITVTAGTRVNQGDMIGRIGMSGRVTGPHLHWGMRLRATSVDPALLVPPMK